MYDTSHEQEATRHYAETWTITLAHFSLNFKLSTLHSDRLPPFSSECLVSKLYHQRLSSAIFCCQIHFNLKKTASECKVIVENIIL